MDKRFQVFVSSTYADLKQERRRVIQALMEMDCIPAGMELFPAADEEQWAFIRRVIDDCDYYVLIIGGRYGSTTPEGISYTEKEYDYAIERGLKVLAFLHENPDDISVGKSDIDASSRTRLIAFRNKVGTGRLVKSWKTADELPGLVALSLNKTIKTYPAIGWVRATSLATPELLTEVNDLRKRNQDLEQALARIKPPSVEPAQHNLAGLDDTLTAHGEHFRNNMKRTWKCSIKWGDMFALVAPHLLEHPNDISMKRELHDVLFKRSGESGTTPSLDDEDFQTIKVQLMALGLVNVQYLQTTAGGMALFWSLTKEGQSQMMRRRTVKK